MARNGRSSNPFRSTNSAARKSPRQKTNSRKRRAWSAICCRNKFVVAGASAPVRFNQRPTIFATHRRDARATPGWRVSTIHANFPRMFITGLGTAAPPQRYTQLQGWECIQSTPEFSKLSLRARAILKKVLTGKNGIDARHLSLEKLEQAFAPTPDILHERFLKNAPLLATQAAERALEDSQTKPGEIDAVIISTCTGYLCPGLTSYVGERLGLRSDVL